MKNEKEYPLSGNKVKALGKEIKNCIYSEKEIPQKNLLHLQYYRNSFKNSLSEIFNIVSSESKKIRKGRIVTSRIKRLETIINKLKREDNMYLSTMQDIAGCRCIVETDNQAYKIEKALRQSGLEFNDKRYKDYIKNTPKDGYKAIHLIAKSSEIKHVEIQIRSIEHHNQATFVEIIGELFKIKIKEGEKNEILERFLYLLSFRKNLTHLECNEIIELEKKINIFEKVSSTFSKNYLKIRKNCLEIEENKSHKYFILEVDNDTNPLILSFNDYENAEKECFKRFDNNKTNTVLTHIEKVDFNLLNRAYSNYTLQSHVFQDDWFEIVEKLIDFEISINNFKNINTHFEYYKSLEDFERSKFLIEYEELKKQINIIGDNFQQKEIEENSKIFEWAKSLNDNLEKREEKSNLLKLKVKKSLSIKRRLTRMFNKR